MLNFTEYYSSIYNKYSCILPFLFFRFYLFCDHFCVDIVLVLLRISIMNIYDHKTTCISKIKIKMQN